MRYRYVCALPILLTGATALAQHDLHRDTMRLIARGKYEKAAEALAKKPDDPESLYLLMVAHSLKGEPGPSLDLARRAVAAGLPFERIVAGPREALAVLTESEDFRTWSAERPGKLLHGPMLGALTDTSARFWVRTAEEASVVVELTAASAEGAAPPIHSPEGRTREDRDFTAVVQVTGLSPDTEYRYFALIGGERVGTTPRTFRTHPRAGTPAAFTIGFGGGAGYIPEHERMWDTIAKHTPLSFLLLGDNVYIDDPKHPLTNRYCYYRRQSRPEWRRFVGSSGIYSIYDDHDFGTNDCVPGPEVDRPEWKREVWRIFTENWNNPAYGGGEKQPGCWYDFTIANVHFIMLDGRYYRDLKGGSMLGPVQKAWFLETLKSSKGAFKVLASPVPWSAGVKPGSRDTWDGFPEEREEIFAFIKKHRIDGVVLLSADRHRSDIRKTARPGSYDLYEFESSRLTNRHTHGIVQTPGLIFGYNKKCSFGLLHFDTTQADPEVVCKIINIEGEEVYAFNLKRSQLVHESTREPE